MLRYAVLPFAFFVATTVLANDADEPDAILGQIHLNPDEISRALDCQLSLKENGKLYCGRTVCVGEVLRAVKERTVWMTGVWKKQAGTHSVFEIDSIYSGEQDPASKESEVLFRRPEASEAISCEPIS